MLYIRGDPRFSLTPPPPDFTPYSYFSLLNSMSLFSLPFPSLPYPSPTHPYSPLPSMFRKNRLTYPPPSFPNLPRDMVNIVYLIIQIKPDSIYTICPVFYCSSSNKYSYFIHRSKSGMLFINWGLLRCPDTGFHKG